MSLSFLANSGGYCIATVASSYMIHHMPLYIVLMISTFIYAAGSLIGTFKPPFAALMVSLVMTGVGGGLLDTAATSVLVHFENGPLLSLAFSFFAIGSMSSPFLVGGLRESERPWELYFWFPFALTCFLSSRNGLSIAPIKRQSKRQEYKYPPAVAFVSFASIQCVFLL